MASHLWQEKYGTLSLNSVRGTTLSLVFFPLRASLVAQLIKNLPAMRETWVQSLGWEDPLETGTAIHSNILSWTIAWTEEPANSRHSAILAEPNRFSNIFVFCFFFLIFIYLAVSSLSCDALSLSCIIQDPVACKLSSCGAWA